MRHAKRESKGKVGFAVIGLGHITQSAVLPAFKHAAKNSRLVALISSDEEKRKKLGKRYHCDAYDDSDLEVCLARPDVDAVYIASPHQYHAADVLAAANNGKHAIVEKPMALTVEECRMMTDAAESNGTVLVVGHSHGFNPTIKLIRELIASGDVGPLRMMTNLVYTSFLYRPRRAEELDTAQGGG
ncbi:MAG TPA: Gfo/Idh/MocA family oxidoreductase, partial [Myxococcales bacterium]|nr:Gfo/Idh/MocA family oxidoreductase [Myxococcales bacterium]